MTLVSCCVLCPFFHVRYTISLCVSSSSHASSCAMWSSQLPGGGFHVAAFALAGGSESAGCSPFLLCRFPLACGVPEDARPRFLCFSALALSSRSFSRPPMLSRYSFSASEALSL